VSPPLMARVYFSLYPFGACSFRPDQQAFFKPGSL
jgi:hypothetical protein